MSDYRVERWQNDYAPDIETLRNLMIREGYRVYQWTDKPGMIYGLHEHNEDQSHWIISGALELSIENVGTFVLRAGDRDFMPAGTRHSARVISGERVVYLIGERI